MVEHESCDVVNSPLNPCIILQSLNVANTFKAPILVDAHLIFLAGVT